jgi:VIT1/CCC1 family predicted Fe2+/Mn2+ transporter
MDRARVSYFRNFVFGVEDSLVSTVGLLSGIAIAGVAREQIFLTGVVLIFVEAISMAAGSFLAESSAEEFETHTEKESPQSRLAALVMFVSYFVSGFVPLVPYVLLNPFLALPASIIVSLLALALLGVVGARLSGVKVLRNIGRMVLIGGLAILVGTVVGVWLG